MLRASDPLRSSPLCALLRCQLPVVQGALLGAATPELVAACCDTGALGTVALGPAPRAAARLEEAVAEVRMYTDSPFAVNIVVRRGGGAVFAPATDKAWLRGAPLLPAVRAELSKVCAVAADGLDEVDLEDGAMEGRWDGWRELAEALIREEVTVLSFSEGVPPDGFIRCLQDAGIRVIGTATTPAEADMLQQAGVDAVVARGQEAGGPVGSFTADAQPWGLLSLVPQVVRSVKVPVIAAGGIMDSGGVLAALALGASGVQLGTALLCSYESASQWKGRITADRPPRTVLTRAYQGRPVRCLDTPLTAALAGRDAAIPEWPVQTSLTMSLPSAGDLAEVWAGEGVGMCTTRSCRDVIFTLVEGVYAGLGRRRPASRRN
eukprot:TRINITY_DN4493_c4_g1_i1.p1 TRINITY_DN4493_c4_g1~~TRINITY_DN4493_c4_g1_i1.p1  ORF type:complete len:392 (+),score=85.86 TRINITY_DN4493_c4_g1_i1:44-1177(+)